ncbi:MAG: TolC family protein [Bacteroidetes bacterium]|nr:TolC family protein [Bacteroidota bacterium]
MCFKKYFVFTACLLIQTFSAIAQEDVEKQQSKIQKWTFQQCVDHALQNNIRIKQSELNVARSEANLSQSMANFLPDLNGGVSHGYNFGRSIDPFTNQFTTERIQSNNFSLNSSITLFSGFQNLNSWKQSKTDLEASQFDSQKAKNDIILAIADAYLQILFSSELVENAAIQLVTSQKQLERTGKLVNAGSLPESNFFEMKAQAAQDELTLVNAENQLDISKLNLAQFLDLESYENFDVAKPDFSGMGKINFTGIDKNIFNTAEQIMPEIKSADLKVASAEKGIAISRGSNFPRLSLSGSMYTGYSSARENLINGQLIFEPIGFLTNNPSESVTIPIGSEILFEKIPFSDQFNDNFSQSLSFNLSLPIFNRLQTRTATSKAIISQKNAEFEAVNARNQLRKEIQQASANAKAADKKYIASKNQVEAQRKVFKNTEVRYNQNMVNTVDYNIAKNNLTKAESDLVQAKYELIFKLKILDFYQGKDISF